MDYRQSAIRNWLLKRDALKISKLEEKANIPKDSLLHFMKEKRTLPENHLQNLIFEIRKYGYTE